MQWDKEYVREKYGAAMLGQEVIYYPCENAKRLIVNFTCMHKDRFDRYSRYWSESEMWADTAYLFVKDDDFHYYVGTDEKPRNQTYRKLIAHHMELANVKPNQVFTMGSSMGGYGALYYASFMGLNGALIAYPQVDYASTRAHKFQNWERQIREVGSQWYDLDEFIFKGDRLPNLYIEYGNYRADLLAAGKLIDAYNAAVGPLLIVKKTDAVEHSHNECLQLGQTAAAITLFEQLS